MAKDDTNTPARGQAIPRAETRRLVAGRGRYTGDIVVPRMLHAAFLRSPAARGRIAALDTAAAAAMPGVAAVLTGDDLAAVVQPLVTRTALAPEHRPPDQWPLARETVTYQGEAVALVVAETRAAALDAVEAVALELETEDPARYDDETAAAILAHPGAGSNLMLDRRFGNGAPDAGKDGDRADAGGAAASVHRRFVFERQTGVPLEPRAILADWDPADRTLTVWQSGQVPHQMQDVFARLLGLPAHKVRVVCPDVGGAFGIKLHAYPDECAVVAAARILGRPVRWAADRLESFLADVHAREFAIEARLAVGADGAMAALDADVTMGAGPYSIHPRTSIGDASLTSTMIGAAYACPTVGVQTRVLAQNRAPTGAYRGVGQPVSMAVTELLIDDAADRLGIDPLDLRRRNYPADGAGFASATGIRADALSFHACLDRLEASLDYAGLRARLAAARAEGRIEGLGVATLVELTAPGPGLYGAQEIDVTAEDTATVALLPGGVVRAQVGCTDQGQGTLTGVAQLIAERLGLTPADVSVTAGDSAGPVGGGAWASRGLSIGGEAAWRAAGAVAERVAAIAGALLQEDPGALTLAGGQVVDRAGQARLSLAEVAQITHFRQHTLPDGVATDLTATRSFAVRSSPYFGANGVQACHLSIDPETGAIALLDHWVVEDCGPVVNPALVDGQIYGGVVQGLGAALMERCVYDADGNLLTGSFMDYAIPRAGDVPPIHIAHVETPQPGGGIGVKGAGEAGVIGAVAAVWCAVNDALRPLGAQATVQPFTPERLLAAIRSVTGT
jgi:carbon-monoxide dehydrogenase large subunit